jgi:hypothetical protein
MSPEQVAAASGRSTIAPSAPLERTSGSDAARSVAPAATVSSSSSAVPPPSRIGGVSRDASGARSVSGEVPSPAWPSASPGTNFGEIAVGKRYSKRPSSTRRRSTMRMRTTMSDFAGTFASEIVCTSSRTDSMIAAVFPRFFALSKSERASSVFLQTPFATRLPETISNAVTAPSGGSGIVCVTSIAFASVFV